MGSSLNEIQASNTSFAIWHGDVTGKNISYPGPCPYWFIGRVDQRGQCLNASSAPGFVKIGLMPITRICFTAPRHGTPRRTAGTNAQATSTTRSGKGCGSTQPSSTGSHLTSTSVGLAVTPPDSCQLEAHRLIRYGPCLSLQQEELIKKESIP